MSRKVSGLRKKGFAIIISLLVTLIKRIKDDELREMMTLQFVEPLQTFGKVLTDDNSNDVKQIKAEWKHINGDFNKSSLINLQKLIEIVVKDEDFKEIITDALDDYIASQPDSYKTPPAPWTNI